MSITKTNKQNELTEQKGIKMVEINILKDKICGNGTLSRSDIDFLVAKIAVLEDEINELNDQLYSLAHPVKGRFVNVMSKLAEMAY